MGWFSSKSEPYFILGDPSERIPPKHYGYYTMRWSLESSGSFFEEIENKAQMSLATSNEISLFKLINDHKFFAQLQYWSFSEAVYLVYAFSILNAPMELLDEMREGIIDGIKDIRNPEGMPLTDREIVYVFQKIMKYAGLITEDLLTEKDPDVFDVRGSKAFQFMMESFEQGFEEMTNGNKNFSAMERMYLQNLVDGHPISVITTLQQETKMKFSPATR
jgi:hypothetical protein